MDIDVPSAIEVFTTLRYTNLHLLYLLYLLEKDEFGEGDGLREGDRFEERDELGGISYVFGETNGLG